MLPTYLLQYTDKIFIKQPYIFIRNGIIEKVSTAISIAYTVCLTKNETYQILIT